MKKMIVPLAFACLFAPAAWAGDEEACLDCHIPEEDWVGLSAEEVYKSAADTGIKRHKDNGQLSEEQLKAIIEALLQPAPADQPG
ncbi:MAG: hypothetical protein R3228_16415 [Halioglobus sp.]|nr:hypothetical protein [Halioglobus sp.]